ncbi:MAG: hypothetical protein WAU45_08705, partial [Blastocatellia bacterium]
LTWCSFVSLCLGGALRFSAACYDLELYEEYSLPYCELATAQPSYNLERERRRLLAIDISKAILLSDGGGYDHVPGSTNNVGISGQRRDSAADKLRRLGIAQVEICSTRSG